MSEIAVLLQEKAGLSPDKAAEVEQIVVQHITARVPSEFQGIVASALGESAPAADGQPAPSGGLGSVLGAVSGLFGGSKG